MQSTLSIEKNHEYNEYTSFSQKLANQTFSTKLQLFFLGNCFLENDYFLK